MSAVTAVTNPSDALGGAPSRGSSAMSARKDCLLRRNHNEERGAAAIHEQQDRLIAGT